MQMQMSKSSLSINFYCFWIFKNKLSASINCQKSDYIGIIRKHVPIIAYRTGYKYNKIFTTVNNTQQI